MEEEIKGRRDTIAALFLMTTIAPLPGCSTVAQMLKLGEFPILQQV